MTDDRLTPAQEQRIREAFKAVPFAHFLGITLGSLTRGEATLHLDLRDEMRRNNGIAHGGVVASLADTAAAFAIMTTLETEQTTNKIDLTINYIPHLLRGQDTAHARARSAGRRTLAI